MARCRDRARDSRHWDLLLFMVVALYAAAGCNDTERVPISGIAFRDGKPLSGVYLGFEGTAAHQPAGWGMTDASGRFQAWGSGKSSGLVSGTYRVWLDIRSLEPDPHAAMNGQSPADRDWAKRYSHDLSPLTVVIDQARDDLRIDLD